MGLERGGTATLRPMSPNMATKGCSSVSSVPAALLAVRDATRINNPRVGYVRFARCVRCALLYGLLSTFEQTLTAATTSSKSHLSRWGAVPQCNPILSYF